VPKERLIEFAPALSPAVERESDWANLRGSGAGEGAVFRPWVERGTGGSGGGVDVVGLPGGAFVEFVVLGDLGLDELNLGDAGDACGVEGVGSVVKQRLEGNCEVWVWLSSRGRLLNRHGG